VIDDTLSPALRQRGQLLLSGRIRARDAEPLALAYAVRHIARHPNLEADAFRRSREDVALAEIRMGLGDWARIRFGEAVSSRSSPIVTASSGLKLKLIYACFLSSVRPTPSEKRKAHRDRPRAESFRFVDAGWSRSLRRVVVEASLVGTRTEQLQTCPSGTERTVVDQGSAVDLVK
jgi:hypothetical protein